MKNAMFKNLLNRLENKLANQVASAMVQNASLNHKSTISAVVIRKNGQVEDLGVISEAEVSPFKFSWFGLKKLFNKQ